jgi:hypothetical protein
MKKICLIVPIIFAIALFILVGYDERHDTIECTVVQVTETTVTVEAPNGHLYDYYLTIPVVGKKVKVTFDNRGTETNPYDDEVTKIASID